MRKQVIEFTELYKTIGDSIARVRMQIYEDEKINHCVHIKKVNRKRQCESTRKCRSKRTDEQIAMDNMKATQYFKDHPEYRRNYWTNISPEQKERKSEYMKQYHIDRPEYRKDYAKNNPDIVRKGSYTAHAKRRGWGDIYRINKWFPGSELHHLHINNKRECMYIPRGVHRLIGHRYTNQQQMQGINDAALEWADQEYNLSLFRRGL